MREKKYSTLSNLYWIFANSWKHDKLIFLYIALYSIFNSFSQLILVVLPKLVIDELTGGKRISTIMFIVLIFSCIYFISNGVIRWTENVSWPRYIVIRMKIKKIAALKFMTMKQANIENPSLLDLCERADAATTFNENGFEGMFRRSTKIFGVIITLTGCVSIIYTTNSYIIAFLLFLTLINFLLNTFRRNYEKKINDGLSPINRKLDYIFNSMYNFKFGKDIRIFKMGSLLENIYIKESIYKQNELKKVERKKLYNNFANIVISTSSEIIIYLWLVYSILYKGMTIGNFTMYSLAIKTLFGILNTLFDDLAHIRQQSLLMNDFRNFLNYQDENEKKEYKKLDMNNKNGYCIEFENVYFKYPSSDCYVLKNISIKIKVGERLAIVGLNGSGKTTFVKLLTKLYEPTEGRILLNGIDIQEYNREDYYKLFSVVFQDFIMFAFSISENISMLPENEYNREKINESIELSGLSYKVNNLKEGTNTSVLKIIDEDGIEFSGGESQKIALARALYKDAPIIILDEPTAALDPLAEYDIYCKFDKLISKKTGIYISHRLSSTMFCDEIAMFSNGEIIEYGTHNELINNCEKYAEMFNLQAQYYREGEVVNE